MKSDCSQGRLISFHVLEDGKGSLPTQHHCSIALVNESGGTIGSRGRDKMVRSQAPLLCWSSNNKDKDAGYSLFCFHEVIVNGMSIARACNSMHYNVDWLNTLS